MTTLQAPPESGETATAGQVAGRRWRRSRGILFAVLALAVVAVVLAALRPRVRPEFLEPESSGQQGTHALVTVVRQRGTPVTVVRSASAAASLMRGTSDALLVVARSQRLLPSDLGELGSLPGDRLLLAPDDAVLRALAPGVEVIGNDTGVSAPGCSLSAAAYAGNAGFFDSEVYTAPSDATRCYFHDGRPNLVQLSVAGSTVTVLGSGHPLTNEHLAEEGNASLGMNLLGARPSVVWLLPDPPPPGSGGQKSFGDLVPFGVKLAFLQMIIAVFLVALWRARRLGPVVVEPLPVVVRSAEAVEGRARLYRSRRAGDRAAQALRTGALERLTGLLGLPRSAASDPSMASEIVAALAEHTEWEQAVIGGALYGPPPMDDAELVRLAGFLDDLERQVRNS